MFAAKVVPPLLTNWPNISPIHAAEISGLQMIINPPGYLLTEEIPRALQDNNQRVIWLRVGPEDQDPATLLLSIIHMAQRIDSNFGCQTLERMQTAPGPTFGWPNLYRFLAEELAGQMPSDCVFVLEHAHWLGRSQAILNLLAANFLSALPSEMVQLVLTHERVSLDGFPVPLRLFGDKDLRIDFRSASTLARTAQADLTPEVVRKFLSMVDGQVGLLAAVITACQSLGVNAVWKILHRSRSSHHILTRITREMLYEMSPDSLQTLALALQLDYLHPDLSEAVFGKSVALTGPWMQSLEDGWQRIRCLWKAPLKAALPAAASSWQDALHRSAHYLLETGAVGQAIHLYLELNDQQRAAQALNQSIETMMRLGQWQSVERWLGRLAPQIMRDWPWLLYLQGEIAAAHGNSKEAQHYFVQSRNVFSERKEYEGACQSLLAESALFTRLDNYTHAMAQAVSAQKIANDLNLSWYQGWANWQLGYLSVKTGKLGTAFRHFVNAAAAIPDSPVNRLFTTAVDLANRQQTLVHQQEFHQQAYLQAAQEVEESARQLEELLDDVAPNIGNLLSTYGWSSIPLHLKLPILLVLEDQQQVSPLANLWQGLLQFIRLRFRQPDESGSRLDSPPPGLPVSSVEPAPPVIPFHQPLLLPDRVSTPAEARAPIPADEEALKGGAEAALVIYCLGSFRVYQQGRPAANWTSRKALTIFKYLVSHRRVPVAKEVLMELLWPESDPEAARRNLHQAIYSLRQALKSGESDVQHIQFEKDCYLLNPELKVWIDFEEFERHARHGEKLERRQHDVEAIQEYGVAEELYQDHFLAEDLYEDWIQPLRQRFWQTYLQVSLHLTRLYLSRGDLAAAITISRRILDRDNCQEEAHQNLMRCYLEQGQRHLAVQQYQLCVKVLREELNLNPSTETKAIFEQVSHL